VLTAIADENFVEDRQNIEHLRLFLINLKIINGHTPAKFGQLSGKRMDC
jgi:hypothetical protein